VQGKSCYCPTARGVSSTMPDTNSVRRSVFRSPPHYIVKAASTPPYAEAHRNALLAPFSCGQGKRRHAQYHQQRQAISSCRSPPDRQSKQQAAPRDQRTTPPRSTWTRQSWCRCTVDLSGCIAPKEGRADCILDLWRSSLAPAIRSGARKRTKTPTTFFVTVGDRTG
jgi:hypothetical protein